MKKEKEDAFNFEKAVEDLQKIVSKLESGNLPLDEALKNYEEGVKLGRLCHGKLKEVEQRIEILVKESAEGIQTRPFEQVE